jgi:hypothetical protein
MLLTRNTYITSIAVCACALMLWFVMSNKPLLSASDNQPVSQVPAIEKAIDVKPVENAVAVAAPATPKITYKEDYGVFGGNPSDSSEVDQWQISMGYSDSSLPKSEYVSYDDATLHKLVDSGDMKAMLALAERYSDTSNPAASLKMAAMLYHKAAVYGSTAALQTLTTIAKVEVNSTLPKAQQHVAKLEVIALSKAAAIRGDMGPLNSIFSRYEDQIQFTASDFEFIDKRGQEIYNELQQQRNELGLGLFDNSIPDAVRRSFIPMAQFHESKKSVQYQYAQYEKSKQK